jgi:hypothetical protein
MEPGLRGITEGGGLDTTMTDLGAKRIESKGLKIEVEDRGNQA